MSAWGKRVNEWAAARFDAVALAKFHGNELDPAWVDLIAGPCPLEDR